MSEYSINKFEYEGNIYNFMDSRLSGVLPVIGTQSSITNSWTGKINVDELFNGLTIAYYLPMACNTGAISNPITLKLKLNTNVDTAVIPCYEFNGERLSSEFEAGSMVFLTYWAAGSETGVPDNRWVHTDYSYVTKYVKHQLSSGVSIKEPNSNYSIGIGGNTLTGVRVTGSDGNVELSVQDNRVSVNRLNVNDSAQFPDTGGQWVQSTDNGIFKINWVTN